MNKIDTSPDGIRELVNREVSRSHDDYYSQACKLHDALQMLLAILAEKEAAENSNVEKVAFIQKTLTMGAPLGRDKLQEALSNLALDAKTAPFLDIHHKSTHKKNL